MKNLIISAVLLASTAALAGPPVKYPKCAKSIQIRPVVNGAGVYFSANCDVAYVLPPTRGSFEISALTPSSNLDLCPTYEKAKKAYDNAWSRYLALTERQKGNSANSSANEFGNTSLDGSSSTEPVPVATIDPNDVEELKQALEHVKTAKEGLKLFDDKEGIAIGKVSYFLNWSALVEAYKKANPSIRFERLPLEAGRIAFGRKVGAQGEIVTGAASHTIHGIENTSAISADGTLAPGTGAVIMGDAISGQIVLNYAGACPFVKNGQLPSNLSKSQLENYLSSNFQYKYSLQSLRKYRATFNLASIAKHIQESHTSGGFFNSKTTHTITNTNSYNDEFHMEIESDQASFEFDDKLRTEVKTELINRVLTELGARTGEAVAAPALIPPTAHGAQVTADALQKVPNIYAQIGAVSLRVLDSIFGKSDAVASYIRERNAKVEEVVSERRMFSYNGSTVFTIGK